MRRGTSTNQKWLGKRRAESFIDLAFISNDDCVGPGKGNLAS
jgi:hypothetical protein